LGFTIGLLTVVGALLVERPGGQGAVDICCRGAFEFIDGLAVPKGSPVAVAGSELVLQAPAGATAPTAAFPAEPTPPAV
jgi:hypothetical protein